MVLYAAAIRDQLNHLCGDAGSMGDLFRLTNAMVHLPELSRRGMHSDMVDREGRR